MTRTLPLFVVEAILAKSRLLPGHDTVELACGVTAAIGWSERPVTEAEVCRVLDAAREAARMQGAKRVSG